MAEVTIKFRDKDEDVDGGNIGLTFEFDPEIDGDAVGEQLTPAQHLAMIAIRAVTEEMAEQR